MEQKVKVLTHRIFNVLIVLHGIQLLGYFIKQFCLKMFLTCLAQMPSVLRLRLRQQMSLIFFNYEQQVFFDLQDSCSQISLHQVLHSFQFHPKYVEIVTLVSRNHLTVDAPLHLCRNFAILLIYTFAHKFYKIVLVRQDFWRHFLVAQQLFHVLSIEGLLIGQLRGAILIFDHHVEGILLASKLSIHRSIFIVEGEEGGLALNILLFILIIVFLLTISPTELPLIIINSTFFPQKFIYDLLVIVFVLGLLRNLLLVSKVV